MFRCPSLGNLWRRVPPGGYLKAMSVLIAAIQSEDTSPELKLASANAVGKILGRANVTPAETFETLLAVLQSDANDELRMAVAVALGKASLVPGNSLRVVELLRTIGSVDG